MTGPTAADVREAFPAFEIVLTGGGPWQARLPGGLRIVAGTLAQLAAALNEVIAGSGTYERTGQ